MIALRTDKGKTYNVNLIVAPSYDGSCVIMMDSAEPLSGIAVDFDGVNRFEAEEENGKITVYGGYSVLFSIMKGVPGDENIQIVLRKPKETGGD